MADGNELQSYLEAVRSAIRTKSLNDGETNVKSTVSHRRQDSQPRVMNDKSDITSSQTSFSMNNSYNDSKSSSSNNGNLKNVKLISDYSSSDEDNTTKLSLPSKPRQESNYKIKNTEVSLESWMKSSSSEEEEEEETSRTLFDNIHTIDEIELDENNQQLLLGSSSNETINDQTVTEESISDKERDNSLSKDETVNDEESDYSGNYSNEDFEQDIDDENLTTVRQTDHLPTTDAATQTNSNAMFLESQLNMDYLRATPLLPHIVTSDTLEALTGYSPSVLALQDLVRSQITLTRHLIEQSQSLSESILNSSKPDYHYTTVDETKQFIKHNKPKTLSYDNALKLVKNKRKKNAKD